MMPIQIPTINSRPNINEALKRNRVLLDVFISIMFHPLSLSQLLSSNEPQGLLIVGIEEAPLLVEGTDDVHLGL